VKYFGKKKSNELIIDSSYPILKYPKIKESNEIDLTKQPSLRVKLDKKYDQNNKCYGNEWDVEIFDKTMKKIFPNDDPNDEPMNHVTKQSVVVALIKCTGIWMNDKNWGITFKVSQVVVISHGDSITKGVCQIVLNPDEIEDDYEKHYNNETTEKVAVKSVFQVTQKKENFIDDEDEEEPPAVLSVESNANDNMIIDDEDDDEDVAITVTPTQKVETVVPPTPAKKIIKKVAKK
jgi:hypothetical protein